MLKNKPSVANLFGIFFIVSIIFIPFISTYQNELTSFLFSKSIQVIEAKFFQNALRNVDFSSDTIGLNILIFLLFILAFCIAGISILFKINSKRLDIYSHLIVVYYLCFVLLKYGFDKIFKTQFYLPEPNILYANFGNLSKDTLFWSVMGTSRSYCITLGLVEVCTAVLLFFGRTRTLGLLFCILIFTQLIFINFSFDISVKTFTILLTAMSLYLAAPDLNRILRFLILHQQVQLPKREQVLPQFKTSIKTIVIGSLFGIVLYPTYQTSNYNDDQQVRPFLHGAYQVEEIITNGDTLSVSNFPYSQFYIHRKNFMIFKLRNGQMEDYFLKIDPIKKQFILTTYSEAKIIINYIYSDPDSTLTLNIPAKKPILIHAKALNWKKLPALQKDFHYTIDEIN